MEFNRLRHEATNGESGRSASPADEAAEAETHGGAEEDDRPEPPNLADSDDEEDVPDMPNHLLSAHQRRRRERRLELEQQKERFKDVPYVSTEGEFEPADLEWDSECESESKFSEFDDGDEEDVKAMIGEGFEVCRAPDRQVRFEDGGSPGQHHMQTP